MMYNELVSVCLKRGVFVKRSRASTTVHLHIKYETKHSEISSPGRRPNSRAQTTKTGIVRMARRPSLGGPAQELCFVTEIGGRARARRPYSQRLLGRRGARASVATGARRVRNRTQYLRWVWLVAAASKPGPATATR